MRKSLLIFLILIFAQTLSPAQNKEIITLKKRIADLEKRITRIEKLMRLKRKMAFNLDSIYSKRRKSSEPFKNIKNWRMLKIGMRDSTVKKILGEPTRISAGKYTTIWWYEWRDNRNYKIGHASFDNRRKLILWVEP